VPGAILELLDYFIADKKGHLLRESLRILDIIAEAYISTPKNTKEIQSYIIANESCSLVYVKWENGKGRTETGERRPITGKKIVTKIQKFEDLEVWKEAVRLSIEIYKSLGECKDYSLIDQIQRSAVSIPSNYIRRV